MYWNSPVVIIVCNGKCSYSSTSEGGNSTSKECIY